MKTPIKILLIEDSDDDAQLLLRDIRRGGYEVDYLRVETENDMRAALADRSWDVIISDYSLPQFNAPQALALLQSTKIDLPFLIVSGTIGEESAIDALKTGAHDFVIKGNLARLVPAIQRELRDAKTRRENQQRQMELEAIASISMALRRAKTLDEQLASLLDKTLEIVQVNDGSIWLYNPATDEIKLTLQRGQNTIGRTTALRPGEGVPGFVVKSGISLVSREFRADAHLEQNDRSQLPKDVGGACIPLFSNENIVGAIFLMVNLPREISPSEVRILNALAEIGGNAIHRTRLLEQSIKQIDRLNSLRTIDIAINSLDLHNALNIVLNEVTSQLKVDAASILLLDDGTNHLVYSAGRGFNTDAIQSTSLQPGQGYAGQAAQDKRVIFIKDLNSPDTTFLRKKMLADEKFVAYLAVPLIVMKETRGVMEIFNRSPLRVDMEWLNFLDGLSLQTAIAINNALLFENLQRSNTNLELAYNATIEGWSHALDLRDKETEGHSLRVTTMTLKLARLMGVSEGQLVNLKRGALLHDIGKMGIPDNILLKPGPLTEEEWEIMRRHPQLAYDMLVPISYLHEALDIPTYHHEKWDGSGYPHGLKGEEIPLAARIFAVIDVWDALTSERPYRPAWTTSKTTEYIRENSGTHFDPNVAEKFLENIATITDPVENQ